MKTEALFSDETGRYRIPSEPGAYEEVTIRFRTAKGDVSCVYLIHGNAEWKMELAESDDWFDYYIILRPWGTEWEDIRNADTTNLPYDDMIVRP